MELYNFKNIHNTAITNTIYRRIMSLVGCSCQFNKLQLACNFSCNSISRNCINIQQTNYEKKCMFSLNIQITLKPIKKNLGRITNNITEYLWNSYNAMVHLNKIVGQVQEYQESRKQKSTASKIRERPSYILHKTIRIMKQRSFMAKFLSLCFLVYDLVNNLRDQ